MNRGSTRGDRWILVALYIAALAPGRAAAQIAGENVNMVSGTDPFTGDPFLQRQNEPSIAVSSANPDHLLAAANDYRVVDVADPLACTTGSSDCTLKRTGDSFLGVFKSLDGGRTWKSQLLPGFPQDRTTCAPGSAYPLCGMPAAADPVVRAGTDGMLYVAGLNFKRDKSASQIFLARFIDLNNKEGGDPTKGTDPIKRLETQTVYRPATPNSKGEILFVDKPWIAVDVPRDAAAVCKIPAIGDAPARSFPAGAVYVAWAQFVVDPVTKAEKSSDIQLMWSRDCGATWGGPLKLNAANSKMNQAVSIAIDPLTGRVYVAWRRYAKDGTGASTGQSDAIMVARSQGRSKTFTTPRVVATITPFDQTPGKYSFRTDAWPSLAVSTDGKTSWAHVVWPNRTTLTDGTSPFVGTPFSRVVMSTTQVHPPPPGEQDPDDPDDVEKDTRLIWSAPALVDDASSGEGLGPEYYSPRGHQFMPSLTFGQGRLVLTYYDTRLDHTQRFYRAKQLPWSDETQPPFFEEIVAATGEAVWTQNLPNIFNQQVADDNLVEVRHTVDVRAGMAPAGPAPRFGTTRVSQFPYGVRNDGTDKWFSRDGNATREALLQQLQFNPPNLPMFAGGQAAFMGDYIDVQGPAFVPRRGGGGWDWNWAPTSAPVFHAVWTSNQDVRRPPDGDWTKYTPVGSKAGDVSLYDGRRREQCLNGYEGTRDQNIYTSRITDGLRVSSPQNAKPLSASVTRAFVIAAENSTAKPMTLTLTAASAASALDYSFKNGAFGAGAVRTLGCIVVPAHSGVARSLFVKLTDPTADPMSTLDVTATETAPCTGTGTSLGRSGFVTLNPPIALASLLTPDNSSADPNDKEIYLPQMGPGTIMDPSILGPSILGSGLANPSILGPSILGPSILGPSILGPSILGPSILGPSIVANPEIAIANPSILGPSILGPSILGPSILGPSILGPSILGPSILGPSILGPSILGPSILGPSILGPSILGPSILGPSILGTSLADVSQVLTNDSNTTISFHLKFVASDQTRAQLPAMQVMVTNLYMTPTAQGCALALKPHQQLLAAVDVDPRTSPLFVSPGASISPNVTDGSPDNVTVALAPGASVVVTSRMNLARGPAGTPLPPPGAPPPPPLTLKDVAYLYATAVKPALVASSVVDGTAGTYQDPVAPNQGTGGVGVPVQATQATLTVNTSGASATVGVTPAAPLTNAGPVTGNVTFVRGASTVAALAVLGGPQGGTATVTLDPPLTGGETLSVFYAGDAAFSPSSASTTYAGSGAPLLKVQADLRLLKQTIDVFTADGTPVADATVTVNGTTIGYIGAGRYDANLATQLAAGSAMTLVVARGPSTVTATGNLPYPVPAFTAPDAGSTFLDTDAVGVTWSGPAVDPDAFLLTAFVNSGGSTSKIDLARLAGSARGYVVPGRTLPAGDATLIGYAYNRGNVTGDTVALSSTGTRVTLSGAAPNLLLHVTASVPADQRFVTTTTLTAVPSGGSVALSAAVTGSGTPTGTITFRDGNTTLATGGASNGSARYTASALSPGVHTFTATYSGDTNFAWSTSNPVTLTVDAAAAAVTIALASDLPSPTAYGQDPTFTITVSGSPSAGVPSGSVQVSIDAGAAATLPLSAGSASFTFAEPTPGAGSHLLTVAYLGDTTHAAASRTFTHAVVAATPTVTLTSAKNPAVAGDTVTFLATVSPIDASSAHGLAPTGAVTLSTGGGSAPMTCAVSGTSLSCSYAGTVSAGTYVLSASYAPDTANYLAATSATLTEVVTRPTRVVISSSPNPSDSGTTVVVGAAVQTPQPPVAGWVGATGATGTFSFFVDGTLAGAAPVSGGAATYALRGLRAGEHVLTARYDGDATYAISSATLNQVVDNVVFSQADLTGDWYMATLYGRATVGTATVPSWKRGVVRFAADGTTTVQSQRMSSGTAAAPGSSAGTYTIDPRGAIVQTDAGAAGAQLNGQMNLGGDLFAGRKTDFDASWNPDRLSLTVAVRADAANVSLATLAYRTFNYHSIRVGASGGWEHGVATFGANASLSLSSRIADTGAGPVSQPDAQVGAVATVTTDGHINFAEDPSWEGVVSSDLSYLVATHTTAGGDLELIVMTAMSGTFAEADMNGTYVDVEFGSRDAQLTSWWQGGPWTIGPGSPFVTPILSVDGIVTEAADTTNSHGAMSLGKDVVVRTRSVATTPAFRTLDTWFRRPEANPLLTVTGDLGSTSEFIQVAAADGSDVSTATVTVNGVTIPLLARGQYWGPPPADVPPGSYMLLEVKAGSSIATATGTMPPSVPSISTDRTTYTTADPIALTWTWPAGVPNPSHFRIDSMVPAGATTAQRYIAIVDGSARSYTVPTTWMQTQATGPQYIQINAYNDATIAGDADLSRSGIMIGTWNPAATATFSVTAVTRTYLYTPRNSDRAIVAYSIDPSTGALTSLPVGPYTGPASSMTTHPSAKAIYFLDYSTSRVGAYGVNVDGSLVTLATGLTAGSGPESLTVNPAGTFLYVGNVWSGGTSIYHLDATTGTPTAAGALSWGSYNHGVALDPTGKYIYIARNNNNDVTRFLVDGTSGMPYSPVTLAAAGGYHAAMHPTGKFLFVSNWDKSASLSSYALSATDGTLTLVGNFATGGGNPAGVVATPDGAFAYVVNYSTGSVAGFAVNATTGALTAVPGSPFTVGSSVWELCVDPLARFLYVGNSVGIAGFTINSTTGQLTPMAGSPFTLTGGAGACTVVSKVQ